VASRYILTFFCNARGFETDLTNHSEAPEGRKISISQKMAHLKPSKPKKLANVTKQGSDTDLVGIKSLTCPITGRLMKDPVMTIADGKRCASTGTE
jgi:hypothetical protein